MGEIWENWFSGAPPNGWGRSRYFRGANGLSKDIWRDVMFLCNIVDSVEQWPSDLDQFLFTYYSLMIHLSELISNYISYKISSSSCFVLCLIELHASWRLVPLTKTLAFRFDTIIMFSIFEATNPQIFLSSLSGSYCREKVILEWRKIA